MFGIFYTTMLVNLKKTEEELWEQIGGLRTDVRKGEKNDIHIVLEPTKKDLKEAYKLYLIMMKQKYLPVEQDYELKIDDRNKVIVAKKEEKVISYISYQLFSDIDKLWKTKICALETIASDNNFTKYAPNTLLYWKGILFMKSLWFEYLNFNGVDYQYAEEFAPLAKYKRKWNGIEIRLFSQKSFFGYIYWRFFRKYSFVKKWVYKMLLFLFPKKFLKY